ncbi:MAG: hypothetical protein HC904_17330 [Blastochloris sp.]|nr:hypothetical protein [Blastochloris sp.]
MKNLKSPTLPSPSGHLGFHRNQITHPLDGFGLLVPAVEKRNILGCLFPSTCFPQRSPDHHVLLTVFMGGMRQPELVPLSDQESLRLALHDLHQLLGVQGAPVWQRRILWPAAIPQYTLDFGSHHEALRTFEHEHPGWFFAGNIRDGISAPDCVASAQRVAQALSQYQSNRN